jgi:hypothetical protein
MVLLGVLLSTWLTVVAVVLRLLQLMTALLLVVSLLVTMFLLPLSLTTLLLWRLWSQLVVVLWWLCTGRLPDVCSHASVAWAQCCSCACCLGGVGCRRPCQCPPLHPCPWSQLLLHLCMHLRFHLFLYLVQYRQQCTTTACSLEDCYWCRR